MLRKMKTLILDNFQNDFMPWGSLGIAQGDEIIPLVIQLMERFEIIVAGLDWHPADHVSFAANHPWRLPGQTIQWNGISQLLWTMHCVKDSIGAEIVAEIPSERISKIIRKGTDPNLDGHSVFFENDNKTSTGLAEFLKAEKSDEVYIMGLAAEFGVKQSALDAVKLGFTTNVIIDGCSWMDAKELRINSSVEDMKNAGVQIIRSESMLR